VFFLHHAQIDRLWAHWQDVHGTDTFEPAHEAHHAMTPFPARVTPSDVADVRALGYRYDDQPPEAPGTRPAWSCSLR
jgi:tyrosinase